MRMTVSDDVSSRSCEDPGSRSTAQTRPRPRASRIGYRAGAKELRMLENYFKCRNR